MITKQHAAFWQIFATAVALQTIALNAYVGFFGPSLTSSPSLMSLLLAITVSFLGNGTLDKLAPSKLRLAPTAAEIMERILPIEVRVLYVFCAGMAGCIVAFTVDSHSSFRVFDLLLATYLLFFRVYHAGLDQDDGHAIAS